MYRVIFLASIVWVMYCVGVYATELKANTVVERYSFAYQFIDLQDDSIIAQFNATQYMMPASVSKLFTVYAALNILGADYRFQNKVLLRGKHDIDSRILNGDLILRFDGNPDFTDEHVAQICRVLKEKGIDKIRGSIILDHSLLDYHYYASGTDNGSDNFCYQAPVTPYSINQNCIKFSVKKKGDGLEVQSKQGSYLPIQLDSHVKWLHSSRKFCELELTYLESGVYRLHGCYMEGKALPKLRIAARNVKNLFENWFVYYARQYQIDLREVSFIEAEIDDVKLRDAEVVYLYESRFLSDMLKDVLVYSNNFIADAIFKKVGGKKYSAPDSYAKGSTAVNDFLAGIQVYNTMFFDGSGASRKNLFTMQSANRLLQIILEDNNYSRMIVGNLPFGGDDGVGTLAKKLVNMPKGYTVLAKSGTVDGTKTLAGYIMYKGKPVVVFSVAINQFDRSRDEAWEIIDNTVLHALSVYLAKQ